MNNPAATKLVIDRSGFWVRVDQRGRLKWELYDEVANQASIIGRGAKDSSAEECGPEGNG